MTARDMVQIICEIWPVKNTANPADRPAKDRRLLLFVSQISWSDW